MSRLATMIYLFGYLDLFLSSMVCLFILSLIVPRRLLKFFMYDWCTGGFRLLNLKNDSLRKRFDALKYDVKKIEEVVYDLSIRGLRNRAESK